MEIDELDRRLIAALQVDARASLKTLGEQVGLSSPSVSDRLHRLEARGILRGFSVDLEPKALGYGLQALVRIRPLPGKKHLVQRLIEETPEICECDKVTGDDCYVARLFVRSLDELDRIVDRIAEKADTNTAIVKSQLIARRTPPLTGAGA